MRRYGLLLLGLVCALTVLFSCDDAQDKDKMENLKNTHRVKTISGHNDEFGDFVMDLAYKNEKLDSVLIYSSSDRSVQGRINVSYGDQIKFELIKYVPSGEINEAGKIPVTGVTLKSWYITYQSGWITAETQVLYRWVETDEGSGFYKTVKDDALRYLYEYNEQNQVVKMRKFSTQYKEEPLSKMELEYNGNKLTGVYLYETDNGTWKKTGEMNYSYISGNIDRITSLNHGKEQVYTYGYDGNGNPDTFKYRNNQGDVNVKLKYNPDGFMTSCEYGNGVKYTMTYESGNGNFFMLSGYLNSILGFPVVK